jgi:hypothetical protein
LTARERKSHVSIDGSPLTRRAKLLDITNLDGVTRAVPRSYRIDQRKASSMRTALLLLLFVATASPLSADSRRANQGEPSTITCETVRTYVSQVGLARAKAMARANGMTAGQERRARQCLARKD